MQKRRVAYLLLLLCVFAPLVRWEEVERPRLFPSSSSRSRSLRPAPLSSSRRGPWIAGSPLVGARAGGLYLALPPLPPPTPLLFTPSMTSSISILSHAPTPPHPLSCLCRPCRRPGSLSLSLALSLSFSHRIAQHCTAQHIVPYKQVATSTIRMCVDWLSGRRRLPVHGFSGDGCSSAPCRAIAGWRSCRVASGA